MFGVLMPLSGSLSDGFHHCPKLSLMRIFQASIRTCEDVYFLVIVQLPHAFFLSLTFFGGSRSCIGFKFAQLEMSPSPKLDHIMVLASDKTSRDSAEPAAATFSIRARGEGNCMAANAHCHADDEGCQTHPCRCENASATSENVPHPMNRLSSLTYLLDHFMRYRMSS